jgi:hypothetical protein
VFLPMVNTAGGGIVYEFQPIPVTTGQTIFIDPMIATGYDFQIGAGDPNFASVTLPTGIGDNVFDLWLWSGSDWFDTSVDLVGGVEHFFGSGGVDRFRILDIETTALLNPFNAIAFITGLSFVSDGQFSGTMTPITTSVAAPGTFVLLILALAALFSHRSQRVMAFSDASRQVWGHGIRARA